MTLAARIGAGVPSPVTQVCDAAARAVGGHVARGGAAHELLAREELHAGDVGDRLALRTVLAAGYRGPVVVEHDGGDAMWMQEQSRVYLERLLTDWQEEHGDE